MEDDDSASPPTFENGGDIRERVFEFACRVVQYYDRAIRRGGVARIMAPQLVHASTSLASMLEEARAAESRRDFISKCSIGLKEGRETLLRLRVCARVDDAGRGDAQDLIAEAEQIAKIVGAIVRNARRNAGITYR
jgi:four helix bundle protein